MAALQSGRRFADDILKCIFSNENVYISLNISLKFVLKFELTIFQHWFRYWLGADQATSHYLNQRRLVYWRIYAICDKPLHNYFKRSNDLPIWTDYAHFYKIHRYYIDIKYGDLRAIYNRQYFPWISTLYWASWSVIYYLWFIYYHNVRIQFAFYTVIQFVPMFYQSVLTHLLWQINPLSYMHACPWIIWYAWNLGFL